jgi:hypothetical protein
MKEYKVIAIYPGQTYTTVGYYLAVDEKMVIENLVRRYPGIAIYAVILIQNNPSKEEGRL